MAAVKAAIDSGGQVIVGVNRFQPDQEEEIPILAVDNSAVLASQLAKLDPALAGRIPDIRDIIAFRNVLIHGYAAIEHARVWRIAEAFLPRLRVAVDALLDELGPP